MGESIELQVQWHHGGESTVVEATLDANGGFDATLAVPADASYGDHVIWLAEPHWWAREAGSASWPGGSASFVVSDPRPPTVELTATAPNGVLMLPGGTTRLALATATLSGVPIAGAEVTLRWSLDRPAPPSAWSPWWRGDTTSASADGTRGALAGRAVATTRLTRPCESRYLGHRRGGSPTTTRSRVASSIKAFSS